MATWSKLFSNFAWKNKPDTSTPLGQTLLNRINNALNGIDDRVVSLKKDKADSAELNSLIADVRLDHNTGIFTFTKYDGSTTTLDTALEEIVVNFKYNCETQTLDLVLADGSKQSVDISALITQNEFVDSATIALTVDNSGKVMAQIKKSSITGDYLEPNYLKNVTTQANTALAASQSALESQSLAAESADSAANSAAAAAKSASAAAASEANATKSADAASVAVATASEKASISTDSAEIATQKAISASTSADSAKASANTATQKAAEASASAEAIGEEANRAEVAANNSEESADSAKYYYEQAKSISESFAGALRPMGTVTFANLPSVSSAVEGDMYNVSDQFTTTSNFKEGAGNVIPAGANVYKTSDGKWDVLAGSPVTGVKGNSESSYRRGNVNITPANIGLGNVPNVATNDQTPTFTQASNRANIASGEKLSALFGKIMKWFADLKTVAFSGSYSDLSNKPTIPVAVAVKGDAESTYRTGNINLTPANIGAAASSHTHSASDITAGALPIANGGTGATTADAALSNLSAASIETGTFTLTHESSGCTFSGLKYVKIGNLIVLHGCTEPAQSITCNAGSAFTGLPFSIINALHFGILSISNSTMPKPIDGTDTNVNIANATSFVLNSTMDFVVGGKPLCIFGLYIK